METEKAHAMKRIALVLALVAAASPALAISRYNSLSMTCEQARNAVRREGAVIFRYPSKRAKGMTLYDRYVVDGNFCDIERYAEWVNIPTRNDPTCPVLNCQLKNNLDGMQFIPDNHL